MAKCKRCGQALPAGVVCYLVKLGAHYADGARNWSEDRADAWRFPDRHWAAEHAETFKRKGVKARVVRLVRRKRAKP